MRLGAAGGGARADGIREKEGEEGRRREKRKEEKEKRKKEKKRKGKEEREEKRESGGRRDSRRRSGARDGFSGTRHTRNKENREMRQCLVRMSGRWIAGKDFEGLGARTKKGFRNDLSSTMKGNFENYF